MFSTGKVNLTSLVNPLKTLKNGKLKVIRKVVKRKKITAILNKCVTFLSIREAAGISPN